jgi:hypothetical protein
MSEIKKEAGKETPPVQNTNNPECQDVQHAFGNGMPGGQRLHLSHHVRHAVGDLHRFEQQHGPTNDGNRRQRLVQAQHNAGTSQDDVTSKVHEADQQHHEGRKGEGDGRRPRVRLHRHDDQEEDGGESENDVHDRTPGSPRIRDECGTSTRLAVLQPNTLLWTADIARLANVGKTQRRFRRLVFLSRHGAKCSRFLLLPVCVPSFYHDFLVPGSDLKAKASTVNQ